MITDLPELQSKGNKLLQISSKFLTDLERRTNKDWGSAQLPKEVGNPKGKISIVFAGEYSAGKSTILKMLTGQKDIRTGAAITTDRASVYSWKGFEVVDTPGIDTKIHPEHDKISFQKIANSDLLVYVITYKLFDPYILKDFRRLAIDEDKAAEMILVVNKMEMTNDGNTREQQRILREDLRKAMSPVTPEQVHISFLDAESYLDAQEATDPEEKEELMKESGYASFVKMLDQVANEKGYLGQLTTPIYAINEILVSAGRRLKKEQEDDIDAVIEELGQRRNLLLKEKENLKDKARQIFSEGRRQIENVGRGVAAGVSDNATEGSLHASQESAQRQIQAIISDCITRLQAETENNLHQVQEEWENMNQSPLFKSLENLSYEYAERGEGGGGIDLSSIDLDKVGNLLGSIKPEHLKTIGHLIGYKAKPWQYTKLAANFGKIGNLLSKLGPVIGILLQIKTDHDEAEAREQLKEAREQIRNEYNSIALEFEKQSTLEISNKIDEDYRELLQPIETSLEKAKQTKVDRMNDFDMVVKLHKYAVQLVRGFHNNQAHA